MSGRSRPLIGLLCLAELWLSRPGLKLRIPSQAEFWLSRPGLKLRISSQAESWLSRPGLKLRIPSQAEGGSAETQPVFRKSKPATEAVAIRAFMVDDQAM